jgi:hypothetical protein
MGSVCGGFVKLAVLRGAQLAQRLAFQLQAMGAVHKPVEYGVGDRGIADMRMPVLDWQLAGDDGRHAAVAIVDDFQKIPTL